MSVYGAIGRFIGLFIGLTLVVGGFFYFSKLSGGTGAGIVVVLMSAMLATQMFINKNRRYYTQQESTTFFLAAWLLPLIVQSVFIALMIQGGALAGLDTPIMVAVAAFVLLISALLTMQGMRMAKKFAIKQGVLAE